MGQSPVRGLYDQAQDRESAYEVLKARVAVVEEVEAAPARRQAEDEPERRAPAPRASNRQGMGEAFAKSLLRTIGSQVGRELIRGVLGGLAGSARTSTRRRR